mmetsp:Transcript_3504/g.7955  ORF Transcript_3504/g.7955 Transcript_3504/m.7955 type:complete len:93 (-) Transcript_3504:137-415(-)
MIQLCEMGFKVIVMSQPAGKEQFPSRHHHKWYRRIVGSSRHWETHQKNHDPSIHVTEEKTLVKNEQGARISLDYALLTLDKLNTSTIAFCRV